MNLPVTDTGVRPAGKPDECFYCHRSVGNGHADDCVILQRSVVVKMMVEMVVPVPHDADVNFIEFHRNESSWCANNQLRDLMAWAEKGGNCICGAQETVFVREATEQDHETLPLALPRES